MRLPNYVRQIVALLTLAALVALLAYSGQQQVPRSTAEFSQRKQHGQERTNASKISPSSPDQKGSEAPKWTDIWVAVLTVVLAAVAAAQFMAGALQAKWTRKAVFVARDSADAAGLAAKAAEASVLLAEKTSVLQLRPYVTSTDLQRHWMHEPEDTNLIHSWRIGVVWENSGQTPATGVFACLNAEFFSDGLTPESVNWSDSAHFATQARDLGPGQRFVSRLEIPIDKFVRAWKGEGTVYYWAWVEYDGLQPTLRHRTEVCGTVRFTTDPTKIDALTADSFETAFNAADARCVHKPKTKHIEKS